MMSKTLVDLMDELESDPNRSSKMIKTAFDSLRPGRALQNHVEELIKNRKIQFDGDRSHASVKEMLTLLADIDKPREYDFQQEDVYERRFINYMGIELVGVECNLEKVLAGEEEVTVKLRTINQCSDCAEPLMLKIKGDSVFMMSTGPCQSSAVFQVTVDFPTGEVLAADWPVGFPEFMKVMVDERMSFDEVLNRGISVNQQKGVRIRSERYAANGIAHFFVGNTCPSVIVRQDGALSIRADEEDEAGIAVTNICTDLWWTTMVDVGVWEHMMVMAGWSATEMNEAINVARSEGKVFNIQPGRYTFTCELLQGPEYGYEGYARRITGVREGDC